MKCIYLCDSNTMMREGSPRPNAVITAIVIDAEVRTAFKDNITKIITKYHGEENKNMVLKWSDIKPENVVTYLSMVSFFNAVKNVTLHARKVNKFSTSMIYPAYISIIKDVVELYGPDIRVFIPAKKNGKRNMAHLKALLEKEGISCDINQNPLDESRFYQFANIAGGIISYHSDSFGYFEHIDEPGKSQIVTYALEMKKSKGKITIKPM